MKMKKRIALLVLLSASLLPLWAGGSKEGERIGAPVPEQTALYLQISSPEQLFADLEDFSQATGLKKSLNNVAVRDLVSLLMNLTKTGITLNWFDLTKPMGLGIMPLKSLEADPEAFFLLAFSDEESRQKFKDLTGGAGLLEKKVGDFSLFYSEESVARLFPPKKELTIKNFGDFGKGELILHLKPEFYKPFLAAYVGKDLDWEKFFREKLTDDLYNDMGNEAFGEISKDTLVLMLTRYTEILMSLESGTMSLALNKDGLSGKSVLQFREDSPVTEWNRQVKAPGDIKTAARYAPGDTMLSMVQNVDPRMLISAGRSIMDDAYTLIKIDPRVKEEIINYYDTLETHYGSRGSFFMDLNLDPTKSLEETQNPLDVMNFTVGGVLDVKDGKELEKKMKAFFASGLLSRLYEKMGLEDMKVDQLFRVEESQTPGGLNCLVGSYNFKTFEDFYSENSETRSVLNFLESRKLFIYTTDTKQYYWWGTGEQLDELVQKEGVFSPSLAQRPGLEPFWAMVPKAHFVVNFSFSDFVSSLSRMIDDFPELTFDAAPGITWAFTIDDTTWRGDVFLSSQELGVYFSLMSQVISRGMRAFM